MFMGYHYNKTMFYINIKPMEETMKHKTKTSNDKMTLKKLIKVVNQYIEVESKIKDMTSIKKMLRETILDNQNIFLGILFLLTNSTVMVIKLPI